MAKEHLETGAAWDPFLRLFHWSLAGFFLLAYFLEGRWPVLHSHAGYTVAMLIAFRFAWAFLGPANARISDLFFAPRLVFQHLNGLARGQVHAYAGHNPAGGTMTWILLSCLVLTTLSGMTLFAMEGSGPLVGLPVANLPGGTIEQVHDFMANFTLVLVIIHILGVTLTSWLLGENLTKSMIVAQDKSKKLRNDR